MLCVAINLADSLHSLLHTAQPVCRSTTIKQSMGSQDRPAFTQGGLGVVLGSSWDGGSNTPTVTTRESLDRAGSFQLPSTEADLVCLPRRR